MEICVEVWNKGGILPVVYSKVRVKILVQSPRGARVGSPNWNVSLLNGTDLDKSNMRLVAVWRTSTGNTHDHHPGKVFLFE